MAKQDPRQQLAENTGRALAAGYTEVAKRNEAMHARIEAKDAKK